MSQSTAFFAPWCGLGRGILRRFEVFDDVGTLILGQNVSWHHIDKLSHALRLVNRLFDRRAKDHQVEDDDDRAHVRREKDAVVAMQLHHDILLHIYKDALKDGKTLKKITIKLRDHEHDIRVLLLNVRPLGSIVRDLRVEKETKKRSSIIPGRAHSATWPHPCEHQPSLRMPTIKKIQFKFFSLRSAQKSLA